MLCLCCVLAIGLASKWENLCAFLCIQHTKHAHVLSYQSHWGGGGVAAVVAVVCFYFQPEQRVHTTIYAHITPDGDGARSPVLKASLNVRTRSRV